MLACHISHVLQPQLALSSLRDKELTRYISSLGSTRDLTKCSRMLVDEVDFYTNILKCCNIYVYFIWLCKGVSN